jgi:hypothetical protein
MFVVITGAENGNRHFQSEEAIPSALKRRQFCFQQ